VHKFDAYNLLKNQQMHFGYINVILLRSDHLPISATHVAIFRVVRARIKFGCIESLHSWKLYCFG